MLASFATGTLADHVLTSETVKETNCRIAENTFLGADHRAVFLETVVEKGGRKTNRENINHWRPSPQWQEQEREIGDRLERAARHS